MKLKEMTVWDFVQRYYTKYSSSQLVADSNDLEVIMAGEAEEGSCVYNSLQNDYGGDIKNPLIETDYNYTNRRIYEDTILCFIQECKPEDIKDTWDFVKKYYPDYKNSSIIYIFLANSKNKYLQHTKIKQNHEYMHRKIYEDSIKNFLHLLNIISDISL